MPFAAFIARYGLAAVCLGAGIEGESMVMAGGVAAHEHLLPLPGVMIAGALGSFVADQLFFAGGRYFRAWPMVQRTLDKPATHRVITLLERHPIGFILSIRFLYGLRTVSPIAVGTSRIARSRFMLLNGIAALVWATLFAGIVYELGGDIWRLVGHIHPRGPVLLGVLAGVILAFLLFRLACRHVHLRKQAEI